MFLDKRIRLMSKLLNELFSKDEINTLAYDLGFLRRKGKVTPIEFLNLCVFGCDELCTTSLSNLSTKLEKTIGTSISTEGLNNRFNQYAVDFLKKFLERLVEKQLNFKKTRKIYYFNKIRIADATGFKLPIEYIDKYPGTGSVQNPMSSLKIQFEFDLLSGQFLNYDIFSGNTNDALYTDTLLKTVEKDDLCLRDLGYYKLSHLEDISEKKAYFVSRLKSYSTVYCKDYIINKDKELVKSEQKEYRRIYIDQILDTLTPGETIDLNDVLIGNTQKLKCRLIITKLTEEQKKIRLINLKKSLEKKRIKNSYSTQKFLDISAYITNVPQEQFAAKQVHGLYSLRWQIELIFKVWKSIFKIDRVKKVKIERFHCAIYAKLIAIVLSNLILSRAKESLRNTDIVLSDHKSFSLIKEYLTEIKDSLYKGKNSLSRLINKIINILIYKGRKSKKKNKKTSSEIVQSTKLKKSKLTVMVT
jgi:Transposase DDE domain